MGIPAIRCLHCGGWFSPVHSQFHCEELNTILQHRNERLAKKISLLQDIVLSHRRLVLGETNDMTELDEAIRRAAEDAGYLWAVQEYVPKNE